MIRKINESAYEIMGCGSVTTITNSENVKFIDNLFKEGRRLEKCFNENKETYWNQTDISIEEYVMNGLEQEGII